ncbi:hypothetical protein M9Y10_017764 [Tritrichomonas musculus]|uniref:Leucine-rich repeat domain-containing protein n=1 Tax=Tritrichomonas musculus TaxID=1915356 RepID=A0ABR2HW19_9EUKA
MNDEWCISAKKMSHVEVEPGNGMHSSVIDKSDINNKDYDTLVFWTPESVGAKIPKTIKIIGKRAFLRSNIASILIQANVRRICERAFYECRHLSKVVLEPNSELQAIEKEAFKGTHITNVQIPASTIELKDGWCIGLKMWGT